ncbi:FAD-linked oxidoreductase-like protein [Coniella lustricola]|uniref:Proline dehydrogenase n=1 Tax=Coniella lustricola TaxID=2025994 RepID=A0A2T3A0X1_9PEZI|nr:FAD-linked oxidoreductase-like protein [Coniella lustricola]
MVAKPPLSILPLPNILRSLAVTTISSSPLLLTPSLAIMRLLANSNNALLNPDRNPLLGAFIKSTFYAQFCAGETAAEVRGTIARLKGLGFSGVILCYAKEVVMTASEANDLTSRGAAAAPLEGEALDELVKREIGPWAEGSLETVRLASEGDYVALKFSGAGQQTLRALSERLPPPAALATAMDEICTLAAARGVRLFLDAEQQAVQHGIDDWTLMYMRKYNKPSTSSRSAAAAAAKAVIYGTYQTYLKASPAVVAAHLHAAEREGFTLGLKLVRGAYLGSDPRHLIHDTKADTDACFDGIAEALLQRKWTGPLAAFAPPSIHKDKNEADASAPTMPPVEMVLASHSADSVRKARAVLDAGLARTEVAFAQLQGMADEVSCAIIAPTTTTTTTTTSSESKALTGMGMGTGMLSSKPKAYKYLVWGSTGECMKYLLRRAHENRDAVQRTRDGRDAMRAELVRRVKAFFGLA